MKLAIRAWTWICLAILPAAAADGDTASPTAPVRAVGAPPTENAPELLVLPMARGPGGIDTARLALAEAALRLGLAGTGLFRAPPREALDRSRAAPLPTCFDARCLAHAAAAAPGAIVAASELSREDDRWVLRLSLARAPGRTLDFALRADAGGGPDSLLPLAYAAGLRPGACASAGTGPADSGVPAFRLSDSGCAGPAAGNFRVARGPWDSVPWLAPRDSIDHRRRAGLAGLGLLAAGAALAYAQGQLPGWDGNSSSPSRPLLRARAGWSFLRGFFAAPTLGARYAGMGGAGIAVVDDGLSLLLNPAGPAGASGENVTAAKRTLPDGTPSLFLAYAGPLRRGLSQGLGAQYEGDGLASETTLFGDLACDLGMFAPLLDGIRAGAQAKIYLAQAGEDGNGDERATGHSYGMGLDLGFQAPLTARLTAALAVRDAIGFLRHRNTYTNSAYGERLPAEWKIGAAYRAGAGLTLLLDGQKGVWADQADHLRAGGEQVLWNFLALRAGLHETFGREAVRKLAFGFGLDSGGLGEASARVRLSLDYAYEFGMEADTPLAGGQQFSLKAGF